MEGKKNVPEIRFSGFTDSWEQRKFAKVFKKISNNTFSRAELNYDNGPAKNIHYGDVLIKFGELLDIDKDIVPFVNEKITINRSLSEKLSKGDVIIADAAEDETVGKCTELVNLSDKIVISGLHTIPSRPVINFASGYLGYYMNSSSYHNQLIRLMQGTKVSSISKSSLQETTIIYPSILEEQMKISNSFSQLNNLITLHQRKCEKLKIMKKALLDKMFPKEGEKVPELRFKNFTEDWEQRKLDEIVDIIDGDRGKNYPNDKDLQENGHTLFLSAANVTKNGFKFDSAQYITKYKSNSMGNGKLVIDDIVLTSRGSLGHIAWYNADNHREVPFARINSGMLILRSKSIVHPCIVAQILKSPLGKKQIDFISFGSAQPQLTKKDVTNYTVNLPNYSKEQYKIGSIFHAIDNLITLHQRKLDKLNNIKKSLLEKMFV
jgi:type I restriction enzyme S subunit